MTGDEHRITVTRLDALASGRLTWWPQTSVHDDPIQRGDTIVFHLSAATLRGRGGEQSPQLRMIVTDARNLTVSLPTGWPERTVARILSLRPDSEGSG